MIIVSRFGGESSRSFFIISSAAAVARLQLRLQNTISNYTQYFPLLKHSDIQFFLIFIHFFTCVAKDSRNFRVEGWVAVLGKLKSAEIFRIYLAYSFRFYSSQ